MPKQCCKDTWEKIPDDEPVFIIRGKDKLAPRVMLLWLDAARDAGVNEDKLARVGEHLAAVIEFQEQHPERCKIPD